MHRIPRVQRVPRRLTDGRIRYHFYHRPTRTRLPSPDSPDFQAAYATAEQRWAAQQSAHSSRSAANGSHSSAAPGLRRKSPPLAPSGQDETNRTPRAQTSRQVAAAQPEVATQNQDAAFSGLLTDVEVVTRYRGSISKGTLRNWRSHRIGPAFVRIGRKIFYPLPLLADWEKANTLLCDLATTARSKSEH